jgi:hypothetical protein
MASLTLGMITDPGATTMHSAKVTERVHPAQNLLLIIWNPDDPHCDSAGDPVTDDSCTALVAWGNDDF